MRGIDISSWQDGIVPSSLDIDFCIIKATEGYDYTNPCCDSWVTDCIDHAIPWGFYHFACHGNVFEEADYFVTECKGYFGHGIPVLDYEVWEGNDVSWCEKFLERVHDLTGIWPMLYISASRCGAFENSWIPEKCGLWVAGYPMEYRYWIDEKTNFNYSIYPWSFAAIWQFTSTLALSGWSGKLDGNIAYMDSKAWSKYASCTKTDTDKGESISDAPTKQQTAISSGKSCEQIAEEVLAGKWGVGWNREQAIKAAFPVGTYEHVQHIINEWMI